MKLAPKAVERFLRAPDAKVRAVLVFGPDQGLVRERAAALARHVVPDLKDPFRIAELGAEAIESDPARLADEAAAIPFTGGRKLVRVHGARDKQAAAFATLLELAGIDGFVVAEAGDLPARSSLRKLFEEAGTAAALPCHPDNERDLGELIEAALAEAGVHAAPDALDYLRDNLGSDRQVTRRELEKLALYAGSGGALTRAECLALVGDSSALSLDDVVYAAASGDLPGLESALARALATEHPVRIVRLMQQHIQKLHLIAAQRLDADNAARRYRVHFSRENAFRAQVRSWSAGRAAQALELLTEAELDCKSTGMPDAAICRRALLRIAMRAPAANP